MSDIMGTFFVSDHTPVWFQIFDVNMAALPVALIENLSEGAFDVDIESSDVREGTLTTLMSPLTVQPLGYGRTDIPKVVSGKSAKDYSWCKITLSNAVKKGLIAKVVIFGVGNLNRYPTE